MRLGRAALATSWLLCGLLSNFFALELRAQPDALAVPGSQSIQRPELPAVDVERFGEVELRVPRPTIDGARAGRIAMRHFRRRQVAVVRIVERRSARWTSAGASRLLTRAPVVLELRLVVERPAAVADDLDSMLDFADGRLGCRKTSENFRECRVHDRHVPLLLDTTLRARLLDTGYPVFSRENVSDFVAVLRGDSPHVAKKVRLRIAVQDRGELAARPVARGRGQYRRELFPALPFAGSAVDAEQLDRELGGRFFRVNTKSQ
jgi:hypothetical protein